MHTKEQVIIFQIVFLSAQLCILTTLTTVNTGLVGWIILNAWENLLWEKKKKKDKQCSIPSSLFTSSLTVHLSHPHFLLISVSGHLANLTSALTLFPGFSSGAMFSPIRIALLSFSTHSIFSASLLAWNLAKHTHTYTHTDTHIQLVQRKLFIPMCFHYIQIPSHMLHFTLTLTLSLYVYFVITHINTENTHDYDMMHGFQQILLCDQRK